MFPATGRGQGLIGVMNVHPTLFDWQAGGSQKIEAAQEIVVTMKNIKASVL